MADWLGFAGDIATLGAGFLSSHIGSNRAQGIRTGDIAYDQFSKLQDWQYNTAERLAVQQWEEEMWNKQNEYNSPANQLRLAKEAGINPNAIFGNGNPFEPASGLSGSPMSSPGSSFGGSSSGLASSLLMQDANNLNAFANARKTLADAEGQEIGNKFDKKTFKARVKAVEDAGEKIVKEMNLLDIDEKTRRQTYEHLSRLQPLELEETREKVNLLRNQAIKEGILIDTAEFERDFAEERVETERLTQDNLKEEKLLKRQQRWKLASDVEVNESEIKLNDSERAVNSSVITLNDSITDNNREDKNRIIASAKIEQLKLEFSNAIGAPIGTPDWQFQWNLMLQGRWDDLAEAATLSADNPTKAVKSVGLNLRNWTSEGLFEILWDSFDDDTKLQILEGTRRAIQQNLKENGYNQR